jgi:hypothetical protein
MEKVKGSLRSSPRIETRLSLADRKRFDEMAKAAGESQQEFARKALLWYMDNQQKLTLDDRETEVARAIKIASEANIKANRNAADRICKMLARQGVALGTLFELHWMAMAGEGEEGQKAFEAATNTARQKIRRHTDKDEAELAAGMKRVAGAGE